MKMDSRIQDLLYTQASSREHLVQYEIPTDQAKKLISWYLISKDIQEMMDCMSLATTFGKVKKVDPLLISGMWEKLLITYGKIFSASKDGYTTLNVKFVDNDDLVLHHKLIAIRNSYLAHRGENDYEHHTLIASLAGTETNCKIEFLVPEVKMIGHYENPVLVRQYLKRLKKKVDKQLTFKREKLEQELYASLGLEPIIP
jgi:hypothetical protein